MEASRRHSPRQTAAHARHYVPSQPIVAKVLPLKAEAETAQFVCSCSACPAYELNLCAARKKIQSEPGTHPEAPTLESTVHTISARRTICHPKEWSEFVTIICDGWAASSIALPDGRQQILSFLLPGDFVSLASLLEVTSGRTVEAITEVTYRNFKRSEIKASLLTYPNLLASLARIWNEEKAQADQLALDLGRRKRCR